MRQILCVIDFSESAGKVWEVATRIACACRAHLIVLLPYRLIDLGHPGDGPSLKTKLENQARLKFMYLKETTLGSEDISCEFHPEIGFAGDRISAHLRRNDIDMVVIGQQSTASSVDFKSVNVQSLISTSRLPFLIVPTEVKAEANI